MELYAGIDLHSNNSAATFAAMLREGGETVYEIGVIAPSGEGSGGTVG